MYEVYESNFNECINKLNNEYSIKLVESMLKLNELKIIEIKQIKILKLLYLKLDKEEPTSDHPNQIRIIFKYEDNELQLERNETEKMLKIFVNDRKDQFVSVVKNIGFLNLDKDPLNFIKRKLMQFSLTGSFND